MILITHDLGVVAETCDQVAIMYAGEVVEYGSVWDVYTNPKHPYTRGLFDSIPKWTSMTSGCLRSRVWRRTPPHFPAAATSIQDASTARSAAVNRAPQ